MILDSMRDHVDVKEYMEIGGGVKAAAVALWGHGAIKFAYVAMVA